MMLFFVGVIFLSLLIAWVRIWDLQSRMHFIEGELYALKKRSGCELKEWEEDFLEQYPGFVE